MKKIVLLLCAASFVPFFLWAQLPAREITKEGVVKYQRFSDSTPRLLSQSRPLLRSLLTMSPADSLQLIKTIADNGRIHQLYQQYYKGYKVEKATYAIHAKNEVIESVNGFFSRIGNISTEIAIGQKMALANAVGYIHAVKYGWEDPFTESLYKQRQNDPLATLYPVPELVIYRDDSISHAWRLVYKLHIYAARPLSDNNIYIDAQSGKIVGKENLICMDNTPGTANTRYSGLRNITMDSYNTPVQYRLLETRAGTAGAVQIHTWNMHNGSVYGNATEFTNATTAWGTVDAGLDVHWATEQVFDYWSNVRGRNSYDGHGGALVGYVHADLPGISPAFFSNDNAFWDPTMRVMTYGDGTFIFSSVASLDVIAHETGHGICQFTAGLPGTNSEGGALNEGLSDIWGAVIEFFAAPNKQTWRMGEDIMIDGRPCLRSLQNPKTDGDPAGGYPDTYHGTHWDNGLEPHTNSTVLSHWFYLVSQGASGTNDLGNYYTVSGIGITDAASIVWNAESTGKLQAGSQYSDARTAMINAAIELFGAGSCQHRSVVNAWYAVGIGTPYSETYTITSNNSDNAICGTSSATYTANVPAAAVGNVTWIVSPTGIVNYTTAANTITLTRVADGVVTLMAIVNGGACNGLQVVKKVGVGAPMLGANFPQQKPRITGHPIQYVNYNYATQYSIPTYNGPASSQVWTVFTNDPNFSWGYNPGNSSIGFFFSSSGYTATFSGTETNACGTTYGYIYCQSVVSGGAGGGHPLLTGPGTAPVSPGLVIAPNPVRGSSVIIIQEDGDAPGIRQIKLYTLGGIALQALHYGQGTRQASVSTAGLSAGMYIVEIFDGVKYERKKLVVQK